MKERIRKISKKQVRLLIVDDSRFMRETLRRLCSSLPRISVIAQARNGKEGLRAIRKLKPDVITLDIRMPVMNGIEVLEAIKEQQLKTTIIVLSAIEETIYRKKCFELGACYVLNKTSELEKLPEILSKAITALPAVPTH